MKLTFLGASGEVTGSCYLLETSRARVLIDLGLFQGGRQTEAQNREPPGFDASRLDAVVLTHAHIDHAGRLPLLPGMGYARKIVATPATIDLARILLRDSAQVQRSDAEYETRRRLRRGNEEPVVPLYGDAEVQRVLELFEGQEYEASREVAPGVTLRFVDAGHILGSASVELTIEEGGARKVVVFSGDIGMSDVPIMRDPVTIPHADVVVMESTYGDRDHKGIAATVEEFEAILKHCVWSRERLLLPAFAVGRTQLLMYYLGQIGMSGRLPGFPVYLDSPLAIEATELYRKHRALLDGPSRRILEYLECDGAVPRVNFVRTRDESRALNDQYGAGVIVAAGGMCEGGRIVHHLKHNVWRRDVHVVIAGYQASGTLGRRLVDGAKMVRIYGDWVAVRAKIDTLGGFSAHAGRTGLLRWASAWSGDRPRTFLTHGEDSARASLAGEVRARFGFECGTPTRGEAVEM